MGPLSKKVIWQVTQAKGGNGTVFFGKGPGTDHYIAENTFTDTVPETSGTQGPSSIGKKPPEKIPEKPLEK